MLTRRVCAIAVFGLLAVSSPAHAGWLDFIWELSGPRMLGFTFYTHELGLIQLAGRSTGPKTLNFFGPFTLRKSGPGVASGPEARAAFERDHWMWLSTELNLYHSVGDKAQELGPVWLFGVDPLIAVGRRFENRVRVYGGLGSSINLVAGSDIRPLWNAALKVRPLAFDFPLTERFSVGLSLNIRIYPKEFLVSPRSLTRGDNPEVVQGVTVDFRF